MAALTINPKTPVVLQLSDGKICLLASIIDRIPALSPKVKTLSVAVQSDGVARAELSLGVSLRNFAIVLSRACGGLMDPRDYVLLQEYAMTSDKDYETYLSIFNAPRDPMPCIIDKRPASTGALTGLCCQGAWSNGVAGIAGPGSKKAFNLPESAPDGPFTANTMTLSHDAGYEFLVLRNGDLGHSLVLKVEFAPRDDGKPWSASVLDTMFESFHYTVGGSRFDDIMLPANNALAKAYNLWPHVNNTPPKNPKEAWVATIPVMISETSNPKDVQIPLIALMYHETRVKVYNLRRDLEKYVKFALDVDYVYLDTPLRVYFAQGDTKPEAKKPSAEEAPGKKPEAAPQKDQWAEQETWPSDKVAPRADDKEKRNPEPVFVHTPENIVLRANDQSVAAMVEERTVAALVAEAKLEHPYRPPCHALRNVLFAQHFSQRFEVPLDVKVLKERINCNGACGGFMINMQCEKEVPAEYTSTIAPVVSVSLQLNGHDFLQYDATDLTEFNWLKNGMETPRNNTTLLVPFSRDMFSEEAPHCRIDLSRLDSVIMTFTMNNTVTFLKWSGIVTAVTTNIRRTMSGMSGVVFAN